VLLPNISVPEGDSGTAGFVVNIALSTPNPFSHTVGLEVYDFSAVPLPGGGGTYGTATPGQDYVAFAPFHLQFAPGQQVARFTVKLKGDTTIEGNEEIDVRFDDTEFDVQDNDIDLVLTNDDGPRKPRLPLLLPPNQTMPEPDRGCFEYRVSMPVSKPVSGPSSIDAYDLTTTPVPGGGGQTYGTATPGRDYKAFGTRTLTWATGARVATLPVVLCGDTAVEGDEEIDVRFAGTTTLAVADNDIDLVLANDD
jgi:hypothetical protein